ncbi:MAG: exodeoxyribonuclease V subunit beta [Candidatus Dactylopiibacterium sp.]|nr:exodeoxyribonuclease V subunit beta [Candidatus Dactylopiibacterium sp.]
MNPPARLPVALDALRFPLHGSRLIEASAGTGKTYTIATLYVRLVLGHGEAAAFARALTPPEILVVTFTEAATQELRERIRARLAEAAALFRAEAGAHADAQLLALRADYAEAVWPGCARTLQQAAEWMDEAAVSTIHGWSKRMLAEHAFDSGALFEQTLQADQSALELEVARDYWRCFYYALDVTAAHALGDCWDTPEALLRAVRPLLEHTDALAEDAAPAVTLPRSLAARAAALAELKTPWAAWADALQALLDAAVAAKQVDGRKLQPRFYLPWLQALRDWAASAEPQPFDARSTAWTRLTPAGLRDAWKVGEAPMHPALTALENLPQQLAALPHPRLALLRHATHWIARRRDAEARRRAEMGFDALLTRLDAALHGPNAARLRERIRAQFPVALIDEFQDTDPLQYRIFDAIYRVADDDATRALILIGDPKQAIYAFRGADIHTYLRARRATAGRHYTLARNYRSSAAMVAAVNGVFARAEAGSPRGAFLFGGADKPVPFLEVSAQGRGERFVRDGQTPAALTLWLAGEVTGKGDAMQTLALACAQEVVSLLDGGRRERCGFEAADGRFTPVRPGDIAVLVNTGREASAVRAALRARGVRSVYLSDKESVFRGPQAIELQHWLAACAEPARERLLRAALATPSLGLGWQALESLTHDESAWEARTLQFRGYHQIWQRQGVLPMLRHLISDFGVAQRLLAADAERALTDLLHLAELLQQASATLDGEHALLRHLAEQIAEDSGEGEARRQRLESDAALVKVVTVHKSKGLEYPLVFLPFASAHRAVRPDDLPHRWHTDDGTLRLGLAGTPEDARRADDERLGEDLRKFYVALTRARFATWVGLAAVAGAERSAPGQLLGGLSPEALAALQTDCPGVVPAALPTPDATRYAPPAPAARAQRTPPLPARPPSPWWIASYSSLRHADRAAPQSAAAKAFDEIGAEPNGAAPAPVPAPLAGSPGLHAFPRGAGPGSFLHGLLEWLARERFRPTPEALRDVVARRCAARGWAEWIEPLCAWLQRFARAPLPLPEARVAPSLAELENFQAELEFWFAIDDARIERLDRIVTAHTLGGRPRPPLEAGHLHGMLKGFVDLVFEHEGRYYVADYKSNHLGEHDQAYDAAAMEEAILAHRYDLQYSLYLFALHRQLGARLPDYDYARHVGGAAYLFLRGADAATRGLHFERPAHALVDALDALFRCAAPFPETSP